MIEGRIYSNLIMTGDKMMFFKEHSIKTKLMLFFAVLALALFISMGFLFFKSTRSIVEASKEKELVTLSEETANKIDRFISERYGDINVIASSPLLKEQSVEENLKFKLLESVRNAYNTYDYIFVTDEKGNIIVSSGNVEGDLNYKAWLPKIIKGTTYVSDFTYASKENAYVIYFAAPILGEGGIVKGAVVERMNFASIKNIISNVTSGKSGFAYLIQQDGKSTIESYGKKPASFSVNPGGIQFASYGKNRVLIAASQVGRFGTQINHWYVAVQEPTNEAFEASFALRDYIEIVMFIAIAIIIIFAFISAERITKPYDLMNSNLRVKDERIKVITAELEKSVTRAKNLESLGAMSAGLAHEIRNPLTSIRGYAQFIKSELSERKDLAEDISIIIDEVDRLNKLTQRFLSFARPERPDLNKGDINRIIEDAVKAVSKELLQSHIDIRLKLNELPPILVDRDQIEQVIINLVVNSIQAMEGGGILEISTLHISDLDMVEVAVRDTGKGISMEDYEKVFEPFYTTKDKGTGLGLAICSRIIENHNGFIMIQSEQGKGTTFIIRFPAYRKVIIEKRGRI